MNVPSALKPWAAYLALFPEKLAVSFIPILPRLSHLLGPLIQRTRRGIGEPEGYEGLTRKGPYERLLGSEWLLAEEASDEFIRRSMMKEHLFFELAQHDPKSQGHLVVLFDSGPNQWGWPRLVHVTLLFLFAERASRQGALFQFGFLSAPEQEFLQEVNQQTILKLIQSRTFVSPTQELLQTWHEKLTHMLPTADVWIISDASVVKADTRFSRVEVSEVLEGIESFLSKEEGNQKNKAGKEEKETKEKPERKEKQTKEQTEQALVYQVAVSVYSARQKGFLGKATLDLPPKGAALQILQNPFPRAFSGKMKEYQIEDQQKRKHNEQVAEQTVIAETPSMLFTPENPRLFITCNQGEVLSYPIAVYDEKQPPPVAMVTPNRKPILAVGWSRRNGYMVTFQKPNLVVYRINRRGHIISEQICTFSFLSKSPANCQNCFRFQEYSSLSVFHLFQHGDQKEGMFFDKERFLTRIRFTDSTFEHIQHNPILDLVSLHNECRYLTYSGSEQCFQEEIWQNGARFLYLQSEPGAKVEKSLAMFCFTPSGEIYRPRGFAYYAKAETWIFPKISDPFPSIQVELAANSQVLGLFWNEKKWLSRVLPESFVFVVLEKDKQRIVLTNGKETEPLIESKSVIKQVTISPQFGILAYVTEQKEVHLCFLHLGRKQYTYFPKT